MATTELLNALIDGLTPLPRDSSDTSPDLPAELEDDFVHFLHLSNGGYTEDGFFHVFGTSGPLSHNLIEWNKPALWKKYYDLDERFFVFAEDIFGNQYGFDLTNVRSQGLDFDAVEGPEGNLKVLLVDTAELVPVGESFAFFIEYSLLEDDPGDELRKLYQSFLAMHGSGISPLHHLSFKHPLLLGGDNTDPTNLEILESLANVRLLGQLVSQVKRLPKGTLFKRVDIDWEKVEVKLVT